MEPQPAATLSTCARRSVSLIERVIPSGTTTERVNHRLGFGDSRSVGKVVRYNSAVIVSRRTLFSSGFKVS